MRASFQADLIVLAALAGNAAAGQPSSMPPADFSPITSASTSLNPEIMADAQTRSPASFGGPDAGFTIPGSRDGFSLRPGALLQFRYGYGHRDGDGEDEVVGFFLPRVRLWANGALSDTISFRIRGQFSGTEKVGFADERTISGDLELDQAWVNFKVSDQWGLRFGQQASEFSRENDLAPEAQLGVNASPTDTVFGHGGYQGIRLAYQGDRLRTFFTFSDGARNKNTDWTDPRNADFGLTLKGDWLIAGEWSRFSDFTSRRGSDLAAMLGAGLHWENGARVGSPAENLALVSGIVEFSLEGDGWNAFAAFHSFHTTFLSAANDDLNDFGLVVQGGFYATEQIEPFARFDAVFADADRDTRNDEFKTVTVGFNYYFFPDSNAVKFSADAMYMLDDEADALVNPSNNSGVLSSTEDGQIAIRAQITVLF